MNGRLYLDGEDALPCRFQLGDEVRARGRIGIVTGVTFRQGKVFYEVGGVVYASEEVTEPLRIACVQVDKR